MDSVRSSVHAMPIVQRFCAPDLGTKLEQFRPKFGQTCRSLELLLQRVVVEIVCTRIHCGAKAKKSP
jgi:hypothetical protein